MYYHGADNPGMGDSRGVAGGQLPHLALALAPLSCPPVKMMGC